MNRLSSFVVALLLSCQLSFAAAVESFSVVANEVHQIFSHDQAIDHHHHDDFVTHVDHASADPTHQHVTDSFQSPALLTSSVFHSVALTASPQSAFNPQEPPAIFLDGFLRPPRPSV